MRAIIVLGWRKSDKGPAPEALYVGLDGTEAASVATEAQASGEFIKLGRINNPSIVPLPHVPNVNPDGTVKTEAASVATEAQASGESAQRQKRKYTRKPKDIAAPSASESESAPETTASTETKSENQN